VNFSSAGSSDPEGQSLTYSWTFGDGQTSTAANPAHTYTQQGTYQARLSVSDGTNSTLSTPITITVGAPPTASILTPTDGSTFRAGDVINFSGDATDPDDGALPASAYTWNVDFLHDGHVHPGLVLTNSKSGSFTIPTTGHDFSGNTRYRITLTVTDSAGLTDTKSVIVWPQKVNLTLRTVPAGGTDLPRRHRQDDAHGLRHPGPASSTRSRRATRPSHLRLHVRHVVPTAARSCTRSRCRPPTRPTPRR
jgi:PKD repeat protein